MRGCGIGPLVVVADEDHGEAVHTGEVHRLVAVAPRRRSFAEPAERHALLSANPECERAADDDGEHRREMADDRHLAEIEVGEVDIPIASPGRPVDPPQVIREDAPGLRAAGDVDAEIPVQRRTHVLGRHRRRHPDRRRLVPPAGVERPGDLPLLVQDVAHLLEAARRQHRAVERDQRAAVEADVHGMIVCRVRRIRVGSKRAPARSWLTLRRAAARRRCRRSRP